MWLRLTSAVLTPVECYLYRRGYNCDKKCSCLWYVSYVLRAWNRPAGNTKRPRAMFFWETLRHEYPSYMKIILLESIGKSKCDGGSRAGSKPRWWTLLTYLCEVHRADQALNALPSPVNTRQKNQLTRYLWEKNDRMKLVKTLKILKTYTMMEEDQKETKTGKPNYYELIKQDQIIN